jgi:hypothetical protein
MKPREYAPKQKGTALPISTFKEVFPVPLRSRVYLLEIPLLPF